MGLLSAWLPLRLHPRHQVVLRRVQQLLMQSRGKSSLLRKEILLTASPALLLPINQVSHRVWPFKGEAMRFAFLIPGGKTFPFSRLLMATIFRVEPTPLVLPGPLEGNTRANCGVAQSQPNIFRSRFCFWCVSMLSFPLSRTSPLGVHVEGGGHYGFCSEGCGPNHAKINKGIRWLKCVNKYHVLHFFRLDRPKPINQNIVFQNTLEPLLDYPN